MKQFVLDYLAAQSAASDQVATFTCTAGETDTLGAKADVQIQLKDGKSIAIYIINRAIRIPEIRERYEQNTRARLHTLFVVDGRMMPPEGLSVEPPGWMAALHTLSHGRVYAYWCERRTCTIRPIHMDWKWGGGERHIEYGAPVQFSHLRGNWVNAATRTVDGDFATADFGEGAFWKKRDPNENKPPRYSWRTWNYSTRSRKQAAEPESSDWQSWEDFQQQYADAGGFTDEGFRREGSYESQTGSSGSSGSRRKRTPAQRSYTVLTRHYATLGVSEIATLDEVKRAYRTKAREYHPDLHPEQREYFTAKMAEINAAFEAISKSKEAESN